MASAKSSSKKGSSVQNADLSEDQLKKIFRQMLLIRRFEERTGQQYQMKKFSGFCHLYIGQEAAAVGGISALEFGKDYVFQTYRDHGHGLTMGLSPREVMAELFMKAPGCSKGKGGSMHLYHAKNRFMGGNGIVGGHTPVATGTAFASKYRNEGAVVLCYMGDAAVNQGTFHESLNMAGLWDLPIVYVIENNVYGMGTSVERAAAEPDLYKRSDCAYNIPGYRMNGMDVLEVYDYTREAVERARKESKPTVLEALTYRYRGHSMSDPATAYRTKDELSEWQRKDPIDRLKEQYPNIFTDDYVKEVESQVKDEVKDAIKFADEAEMPDPSEIWTDVYVDCPGYPSKGEDANEYAFPYEDYGPGARAS